MKKRLIATVLTLALLCPMLSMLLVTGASAALEVDDGTSLVSSSNILNEEWNFDDMSDGEVLTNGYVTSHAKGNFTSATKATDSLAQPEMFSAVADNAGGSYIYAENAYLAFQDHGLLLLRNTYEISWRLKVDAIGSNTTLLWWGNTEDGQNRNGLLRYNNNGALGYTTGNSYTSAVTMAVKAPLGEWHSYRARISPLDGRMWLWLDGEPVLSGVVNEYLRDNAKEAESSLIGIFYAWGGSGMKASIDDVKITGVTLDEHLTFDRPETRDSFSDSWNFNDGTVASTDNVAVKIGSTCDFGTIESDTENTTSVLKVVKSSGNFEGPRFTLVGKAADYGKVTYSWKMKYDYSSNYTNVFRILKSDGSYANLFRVTGMAEPTDENPNPTATAELFTNGGTGMGTLKHGIWNEFNVTVYPNASKITVNINGKITQLNTNSTVASILKDLRTNDKELSVMLYAQYGPATEVYIDDFSIAAEPVGSGGDELLDFEELTVGNTLSDEMINGGISDGLFSLTTDGDGKITAAADPADANNKVIYNTNRKMYLDFLAPSSAFEKLKLSFDVRFENMGGFTSFMSSYACGAQGNFLRVKSDANALQNSNDSAVIATLTQGADAVWYSLDMDIVTSTGAVALTVTERDSGTSVGAYSWTDSNIKNSYTGGEALGFRIHYCWNGNFKAYFDNIYAKASASAVETVNSGWNDSTFTMTTTPDISNMANDDWEIATDPILLTPPLAAFWDFNDGAKATAQNGITVGGTSNVTIAEVDGDTVNTTKVLGTSGYSTAKMPEFTLPGTINDYKTITLSFKFRVDEATNLLNMFRVAKQDGTGKYTNFFRVGKMNTTTNVSKIGWKSDPKADGSNVVGEFNQGEWIDLSITFTPASGNIDVTIGDIKVTYTNDSAITALRDGDKAFSVMVYYHTGTNMTATTYIDDISISAKYKLDYDENDVLKTVTDTDGNTRGIFVIQDKEKYLTNQPFELSFDYMMNRTPSGWLNFVKMKMTGTSFAVFRLDPNGNVYNYTSSGYAGPTATSGKNLPLNVAAKKLTAGAWYNFRIAFDPNSGHVMGYIDNVLVCDYNINDVYVDTSGTPLGITKNPTQMYIELASQYSASAIKINDSCFDNVRIRTLNYKEYTKTFLAEADFNNMAAGSLTADSFAKATGLYSKSLVGEFTAAGTAGSRYVTASVKAGDGIAVDMTNGYAPLAADVVAFEGNFTLTSLGEDGKLNIYSLGRGENEEVSLLSVDNSGKLYLGATATDRVLNTDEIYTVKLVFSGISGTGELYVNNEFVAAAPIVAQADLPTLTYTDSMGNTVYVGNKKFLTSESATVKTLSGVMLQSTEMPDPTNVAYPEDVLNFLSVEGSGTWGLVFDDLSVTRDGAAHVYADNVSTAHEFADINSRLWGNGFIAELTYSGNATEITSLVDWTLGTTATSLVKVGGGKLYAADGTTELATLGEDANIAVAVTSDYWENHITDTNYDINATVYVDGDVVGTYTVVSGTSTSSGALKFAEGASDVKVYFGAALRDNRTPADASGVKFDGYNAFSVTFEDAGFFDNAESNTINYVEWAYSDRDKTATDWEGATVKLSEHVTDGGNSFFRIRRPELSGKPVAYMEYNLGAMGEYIDLYSVQMEIRYTDNIASSLDIATVFDKNMTGKLTLLSVDYESKLYFENNGIRYYLCGSGGKNLTVNPASADEFTKIAIVVNNTSGTYSVWVDGQNAWYYSDGQESGAAALAKAIPLNYVKQDSYTICDPKIRLFEGSNNAGSDSVADIDNISIDVIKNGIAPVNYGYQLSDLGDDIRFVATVDTLYSNSVGFDIVAVSGIDGTKTYVDSSNTVFSSVEANKETVAAETLGGRYVAVLAITDLKVADYTFTVRPFIEYFGEKIYGEESVYTYDFTATSAE